MKKNKIKNKVNAKLGVKETKKKRPKSVRDTIPAYGFYENGIIEIVRGYFTQTYKLEEIDFENSSTEESQHIFEKFGDLLNTFDSDSYVQFTIDNVRIPPDEYKKKLILRRKDDNLDEFRKEFNDIITENIKKGRSNVQHKKYVTVCLECDGIDNAVHRFASLESSMNQVLRKLTKSNIMPLTMNERMNLLYHMLNRDETEDVAREIKIKGKTAETFNLEHIKKMGLSPKDILAPTILDFTDIKKARVGNKYIRTLYLDPKLPTRLDTDMLANIMKLPYDIVTTIGHIPMATNKAIEYVETELMKARAARMKAEEKAADHNHSFDNISEKIKRDNKNTEDLMDDIYEGDEKLFYSTLLIMIYGDSEEELDDIENSIKDSVRNSGVVFKRVPIQELGLKDSLPLCNFELKTNRQMTTTTASILLPYTTKELSGEGFFYGLNQSSNVIITHNREDDVNGNGVILGTAGSGKTMSAKWEILQAILSTDDDVIILDPQGEYTPFINQLGGQEIPIQPNSDCHINPLDLVLDMKQETDPLASKIDYITSICEIALSSTGQFSPYHRAIVERCVEILYSGYCREIEKQQDAGVNITIDRDKMPVLKDLHRILEQQREEVAKEIATALAPYAIGRQNTFAFRTNVNRNNRILSYNFKNMTKTTTQLGLAICLNDIWNTVMYNFRHHKTTRVYVDELHVYFAHRYSAEFLVTCYKMLRKWGALFTGITQNVGDMFKSEVKDIGDALINNSAFALLMKQGATDAEKLSTLYRIPDSQIDYILDSGSGSGLMITDGGANIIPFNNYIPVDTKIYKYMSSKPKDFQENFIL